MVTKTHLMKIKMAQSLCITEIYRLWQLYCTKLKMDFRQKFLLNFFAHETESHYNLKWRNDFRIPSIRTVHHGSKSISFLGLKIWIFFLMK